MLSEERLLMVLERHAWLAQLHAGGDCVLAPARLGLRTWDGRDEALLAARYRRGSLHKLLRLLVHNICVARAT